MLSAKEKLMKKISSNAPLKQKGTELTRNLSVSKLLDTMEITKSHIYFWTDKTPFSNFFYNPFKTTLKGLITTFNTLVNLF